MRTGKPCLWSLLVANFQRSRQGQEDQLGALGLVVNMIVLWNTWYMQEALTELHTQHQEVRSEDVERLAPLRFQHINVHGRYHFPLPEAVVQGRRGRRRSRPLPQKTSSKPSRKEHWPIWVMLLFRRSVPTVGKPLHA